MKILIASYAPPDDSGGISCYAVDLSAALARRGHEILFVSPPPGDRGWLDARGIRHVASGPDDDPIEAARALVDVVRGEAVDAIVNNDHPFVQSIARASPCPFVSVGHLQNTSVASLACHDAEWLDYVVAISNDMRDRFVSHFGVPVWKVPLVYNGVPDRGIGEPASDGGGSLRVVFAGGDKRRKGADRVLPLARALAPATARIDWFGHVGSRYAGELRTLPGVALRGRTSHEELLDALRRADVLLHPSRIEGCPLTILEGLGYGVPSIVGDGKGAMDHLIVHGYNGYVCGSRRWAAGALEALSFLAQRRDVLYDFKCASRRRFESEFTVERLAARIEELLRSPTVDRTSPRKEIPVLRWHRPARPGSDVAPLADRLWIRLGVLRRAGIAHV